MNISKLIIFFNIILFSILSNSAVSLKGVSGASFFNLETRKIYGGTTGACPGGGDATTTCNTCTEPQTGSSVLKPCNQKNIHGALKIVLSFQSSTDLTKFPVILSVGNTDGSSLAEVDRLTVGPAKDVAASLSTTWSAICSLDTKLDSSCAFKTSDDHSVFTGKSFFIDVDESNNGIIDPNTERTPIAVILHAINPANTTYDNQPYCATGPANYGLCFYSLEIGDQKLVILGDPAPLYNATPPDGSPEFQAVAFFAFPWATGISATGISNGAFQPVIKQFESPTNLSIQGEPYITGLENYVRYCVFAGQMNITQNIFGFTTTSLDANQMCKITSEVVGVLDGKKCFISTAAFGSDMASEVQIFRNFRDTFLLTNRYGIDFVKAYYEYGPIGARFISDSETLKTFARTALYPLVVFSWIALNYGIMPAVLVMLLMMVMLFHIRKKISYFLKFNQTKQGRL